MKSGTDENKKKKKFIEAQLLLGYTHIWPLKKKWYNASNIVVKDNVWLLKNDSMSFKECEHLPLIGHVYIINNASCILPIRKIQSRFFCWWPKLLSGLDYVYYCSFVISSKRFKLWMWFICTRFTKTIRCLKMFLFMFLRCFLKIFLVSENIKLIFF